MSANPFTRSEPPMGAAHLLSRPLPVRPENADRLALVRNAIARAEDALSVLRSAETNLVVGNGVLASDFIHTAARDLSGSLGSLHGL